MPYTSTYVRQPFAPRQPYQRNSRLIDIALRGSEIEADAIRRQGESSAQMWGNVGNQIGSTLSQIANYQADAPRREREAMQHENLKLQHEAIKRQAKDDATQKAITPMALIKDANGVATYDRDLLTREFTAAGIGDRLPELFKGLDSADKAVIDLNKARTEALAGLAYGVHVADNTPQAFEMAMRKAISNKLISPQEAAPFLEAAKADPSGIGKLTKTLASQSPQFAEKFAPAKVGTREIKRINEDGTETIEIVEDRPGQSFTSTPKVSLEEEFYRKKAQALGVPRPAVTASTLAKWKKEWEALNDQARPADADGPLVAIMDPDTGEPVLVPRAQAVGRRPASTREQGRAVTSGDAGEIAEFNTALDDIATVRDALAGKQATGTIAAAGASMPNWFTEYTGLGTEAKQKQAVIDRVKQVIGKALEGGVLRKEDELKYAKILPTIGDTPDVVTSKLDGLEKAIGLRIQRKVDALADAGYDVSRFNAPQAPTSPIEAVPSLPANLQSGQGVKFTSGPFAGQTWAIGPDGKPKKVSP